MLEELGLTARHMGAEGAAGLGVHGPDMAEDAALVHAAPAILAPLTLPT